MEDLQPNEARLARKGNTTVPPVRPTAPRLNPPPRGSNGRGRGRGKGWGGPSSFAHRLPLHQPSAKPRPFSQNTLAQRPFFHSPSQPHPIPKHSPPDISSRPWSSTSFGNAKRRRIHPGGAPHAENWGSVPVSNPSSNKAPLSSGNGNAEFSATQVTSKRRQETPTSRLYIDMKLPEHCRKGMANCREARRDWLTHQLSSMSKERKNVTNYEYAQDFVRLFYVEEEVQDDFVSRGSMEQRPLLPISSISEPAAALDNPPAAASPRFSNVEPEPEIEIEPEHIRDRPEGMKAELIPVQCVNARTTPPEYARSPNNPSDRQHKRERDRTPVAVGTGTAYDDPIDLTENVPEAPPIAVTPQPHQFMFKSGSLTVKAPTKHTPSAARFGAMSGIEREACVVPVQNEQETSELRQHSAMSRSGTLRVGPSSKGTPEGTPRSGWSSAEDLSTFPTPQPSLHESPTMREITVNLPASHLSGGSSGQRGVGTRIPTSEGSSASPLARTSEDHRFWPISHLFKVMPPDLRLHINEVVRMPRDRRDKTRRILLLPEQSSVLCTSHHGFVERFDTTPPRRRSVVQIPPLPTHAFVEDACVISLSSGPHVVLGHARDEQEISVVPLSGRREATWMSRSTRGGVKGGTSAVCAMSQPCMFASGGHDHAVHLWTIAEGRSGENEALRGSARALSIKHASVVQSLLPLLDTSHKLVSASADCSVHLYDLSSERIVNTVRTSNSAYHVHNAPMPFCVLLEVGHRETQFELRDYRLVPERPVTRFGYRAEKLQGRFVKGDLQENLFACGDTEGTVRVWDIRNTSKRLSSIAVFAGQKVVHVAFDGPRLYAASGDNELAFMDHS